MPAVLSAADGSRQLRSVTTACEPEPLNLQSAVSPAATPAWAENRCGCPPTSPVLGPWLRPFYSLTLGACEGPRIVASSTRVRLLFPWVPAGSRPGSLSCGGSP